MSASLFLDDRFSTPYILGEWGQQPPGLIDHFEMINTKMHGFPEN